MKKKMSKKSPKRGKNPYEVHVQPIINQTSVCVEHAPPGILPIKDIV